MNLTLKVKLKKLGCFCVFFLVNTIDISITTAKSGRIIQVENSGMVGVGVGEAKHF